MGGRVLKGKGGENTRDVELGGQNKEQVLESGAILSGSTCINNWRQKQPFDNILVRLA